MDKINFKAINRLVFLLSFLVILGIFSFVGLLDNFISVIGALSPFYIAFIIIWIMKPFSEFLQRKFKMSAKKANLLSIFLNLLGLLFFLFVILPVLLLQVWDITQNSTQLIDAINNNLMKIIDYVNIHQIDILNTASTQVQQLLNTKTLPELVSSIDFGFIPKLFDTIAGAIGSMTSFIIKIVFAYIIAIYLANDFDKFVEKTLNLLFSKSHEQNKQVFIQSTKALSGYFKGLLIVCTFIATFVTIGAAIIGIPSPLLFGIIAGIFNVIPYLGPILGGIPLVFVALADGIPTAILAIGLVCITQLIESQILQPKIMADNTNLHPVTVILGLIIFGNIFGFVGMLIATPTLAVIAVIIKNSSLDIRI